MIINYQGYKKYLISQKLPLTTIKRKLSSLRKFDTFLNQSPLKKDLFSIDKSVSEPIKISANNFTKYLLLAILVLFSTALGIFGYRQIFKQAQIGQAYPQAPSATTPNRLLSFQARLTDSSDNPITVPTDFRFLIYNSDSASGSAKLWEEQRYIDPDQDGIFSVTLGTETAIPASVFTENANLWLGVTVQTDAEAIPRQRIATVGYALNAETLQGFPPSASASADQIPVITQEGDLVLAAANPMVYSSSGTFSIKGQALTMTTDTGTNGDIQISPDGTGNLDINLSSTAQNSLNITNASQTSGHLISGYVGNDTATGDLLNLSSGAVEAEKFTVDRSGNTDIAGTLTITGTTTANGTLDANGIATIGDGGDAITIDGSSLALQTTGAGSDITLNAVDQIIFTDFTNGGGGCTALETDGSGFLTCGSDASGGGDGLWRSNSGTISPVNDTLDVLIGSNATASAKFAVLNMNTGTPVASMSSTYLTSDGTLATTARQSLTIGNSSTYNTTGNVLINSNGTGNVGIGTTAPDASLDIVPSTQLTTPLLRVHTITGASFTGTAAGMIDFLDYDNDAVTTALRLRDENSNVDLTIKSDGAGGGTGPTLYFRGNAGIGTTAPDAKLEINHATGDNLRLTYNDADGTAAAYTDFSLASDGDLTIDSAGNNVTLSDAVTFGSTTTLNSLTYTWPGSQSSGYVLQTNGSGTLSWVDVDAATADTIYWNQSLGALYPKNSTVDLLVGGQATTSAKFAVLNMDSGTPVASMSSSYWTSDGTLATTARQSLTIGNSSTYNTTGNVLINPNGTGNVGIGTTGPDAKLDSLATTEQLRLTYTDGTVYSAHTVDSSGDLTIDNTGTKTIIADDLQINGGDILTGNIAFTVGDATTDSITLTTDGTGNGEILLPNDSIGPNEIFTTSQTDEYCLTYEATGTTWEWQTCGTGGGGGSSNWRITSGALSPVNDTLDLLIGNTATTSAKFGFINVNSGTPTATIAGSVAGYGLSLTGDGTIATTLNRSLALNPSGGNVGIGQSAPVSQLYIGNNSGSWTDTANAQVTIEGIDNETTVKALSIKDENANEYFFVSSVAGGSNGRGYFKGNLGLGDTTPGTNFVVGSDAGLSIADAAGNAYFAGNIEVDGTTTLGNLAYTWPGSQTAGYILKTDGSGALSWSDPLNTGYWRQSLGALSPINDTLDVLFGANATASAKFGFLNINSGTPTASISGSTAANALYLTGDGTIATSLNRSLILNPDGGNVGIGVANPTSKLDIGGATSTISNTSGDITINSASNNISFSGDNLTNITDGYFAGEVGIGLADAVSKFQVDGSQTGKALAIFNQTGDQDIITASVSGSTVFRLDTSGYTYSQRYVDLASSTYYLDPASTGTALNIAGDAVIGGGEVLFTPISSPTTTSEGNTYYDSDTNRLYLYSDFTGSAAWARVATDMTKYSANNASVANDSYVEIAHNQATNDLSLTGWVYDTISSLWKNISEYSHTIKHALQNEFDDASTKSFDVDTSGTLLNNLNAYWTLNESSASLTTAVSRYDSYGSNTLTDNPATTYTLSGTGKRNNAADFESGNSNFFEIADNGPLSTGDIDFTISSWVNIESTGANRMIVTKSESASVAEYELYYNNTSSRFEFVTYNSSGTAVCTATANNLGTPSTATWYLVVAWHDATANTCNIQVNNGTADSAAESGVPSDTAANFRIGARYTTEALFFDGLIDEVGFWKKTLSTQEKTDLYNSGNGNSYTTHGNIVRTQTALTSIALQPAIDVGTGADGAITVTGNTSINATNLITGRSCADGGDAVNYSVTALTSTTATLSTTPSTGCLTAGDEILLINLQGTTSAIVNLGNYETLRIQSISTNTITFKTAKTKYYGDNATDDTNIGTGAGTQKVILQRVPNYSSVTVNSSINFYPTAWNGTKNGVLFFRATGTVSAVGNIHANASGYTGGASNALAGEAFCGNGGGTGGYTLNTGNAGSNGICGGGGGAQGGQFGIGIWSGGAGSNTGGAGGGGGGPVTVNSTAGGGGGGGGHFTAGTYGNGTANGTSGGTGVSGNGGSTPGANTAAGGGGGGTYGDTALNKMRLGSGGGAGGLHSATGGSAGTGGAGGGIVIVAANSISVNGGINSNGGTGGTSSAANNGCGGGGAGGSVKLSASTLALGTNLVTATAGSGGTPTCTNDGGNGGTGGTLIEYANSYTGSSSSPTPTYTLSGYNTYGLYHSPVIDTPNAATYESLRWETPVVPYGKIEFQTRSGATLSPTDGTWETWKPFTASTNYVDLNTANTHTDWQNAYTLNVADGDSTRNIDQFEDEDESTAGNTTKLTATGFQTDISATLATSLISYWPMNETSATAGTAVTRNDVYSTNHLTDNRAATSYIMSGTGKISNAADLELSNGNFFEKTDNAELSTGDIDFSIAAWVNLESESAGTTQETIISKYDSATVREYSLYYTGATADRMQFELFDSGGTSRCTVTANTFGAVTTATWYYVMAWHDATANTCNISINNGTADSAAETGVPADTAANLRLGANSTTEAAFFDGLIDEVGFWKKTLSTQEKTDLYNSGNANTYPTNGQYAQASITSTDISSYDYVTAWVRASQTGSTVKIGFGESAATEQEETINIDAANTWQKVYWDLSDIQSLQRDAVTKLRFTNLYSGANTISIDNVRAERLLTNGNHAVVSSTPNDYFQYRIIFSTTNTSYQPQVENIYLVYNDGYKVIQTDNNTVRLYNYSGSTQNLRLDATVFGADLAEWYTVDDQSIGPGDLVAITGELDQFGVPILRKTSQANDPQIIGAISTKAGQSLGVETENRRLLALAGRIPVKIASDSAAIQAGDYLTSASAPGYAQKAEPGELAIGKALENWTTPPAGGSEKNTILVLVGNTTAPRPRMLALLNSIQDSLTRLTDYFDIIIANKILAPTVESERLLTNFISPLPDNPTITIDANVSVSGELTANAINSPTIDLIRQKISEITDSLAQQTATASPATASPSAEILALLSQYQSASSSANLNIDSVNADFGFFSDYLAVMGKTITTNLEVTDSLSVANINSPTNSLNLLAGMMILDNNTGEIIINADVKILGKITAPTAGFDDLITKNLIAEEANIKKLTTEGLTIALPAIASASPTPEVGSADTSGVSTPSASITTNATAGKSVLPAGETEFTVNTTKVTANDLIYVTPLGDTQNQVLYVKAKQEGEWFKVAINEPLPFDLEFNWWIIRLEGENSI